MYELAQIPLWAIWFLIYFGYIIVHVLRHGIGMTIGGFLLYGALLRAAVATVGTVLWVAILAPFTS